MNALGAIFEPGVLRPFAWVYQLALAGLLTILVQAFQPVSLAPA